MRRKMEKLNMAPITRRHSVQQAAFAAAFYGCPFKAIDEAQRVFDADEQNVAPLDAKTIRNLRSGIVGNVITPDSSEYEAVRLVFSRAFDRHPAVIVRCTGASDVARSLDFAQSNDLQVAVAPSKFPMRITVHASTTRRQTIAQDRTSKEQGI